MNDFINPSFFNSFNAVFYLGALYTALIYGAVRVFYQELVLLTMDKPILVKAGFGLFIILPVTVLSIESIHGISTLMFWNALLCVFNKIHKRHAVHSVKKIIKDFHIPKGNAFEVTQCFETNNTAFKAWFSITVYNIGSLLIGIILFEHADLSNETVREYVMFWMHMSGTINVLTILVYLIKDHLTLLFWLAVHFGERNKPILVTDFAQQI